MEKYIGTKIIDAEPFKAWEDGPNYKTGDEGYKMFQPDGTFYFCPLHVFQATYSPCSSMNFGAAIAALNKWLPIAREGWSGNGLLVFKQIPADISGAVIPKMQSVPERVKAIIMSRAQPELKYTNQMAIVYPDGTVNSWVPSVSDIFAEDWTIVK